MHELHVQSSHWILLCGSQAHLSKASNPPRCPCWSWASSAAVSDITLARVISDIITAFSCCIQVKAPWTSWKSYCKRQGPRCKAAMESVESLGAQELSVRKKYVPCSLQRDLRAITSSSWGLSLNEWQAGGLMEYFNTSLDRVSHPHLSITCKTLAQGRSTWSSPCQWRFHTHLTASVFLWLQEGCSYHGFVDDWMKICVAISGQCSLCWWGHPEALGLGDCLEMGEGP